MESLDIFKNVKKYNNVKKKKKNVKYTQNMVK